jgi:hypothetical protein
VASDQCDFESSEWDGAGEINVILNEDSNRGSSDGIDRFWLPYAANEDERFKDINEYNSYLGSD